VVLDYGFAVCCNVATGTLFFSKVRATQSEAPIQVATSVHGSHTHTTILDEGEFVLTPGMGREDVPIEWVWQRK
jgi:hypothetical protein